MLDVIDPKTADLLWPSLWLKHLGDLELVGLWTVVSHLAPEAGRTLPGHTLLGELLFQGSEEGPFVMRVPSAFVSAIATLRDEQVPEVAPPGAGLTS